MMDLFEYAGTAEKEPSDKKEKPVKTPSKTKASKTQAIIYSVGDITAEIKKTLTAHFSDKSPITIEGELSNYRGRNASGHMYFAIKDEKAIMPCVFFRHSNAKLKSQLKEGDLVQIRGKVEVYEKGGKYQFVVEHMQPQGMGSLYEKFLALKEKLHAQGLFEATHKKVLPFFPKRVGVVTSKTGSVIRDIIHVIQARAPMVEIILLPAKVQGQGSAEEIAQQIQAAQDPSLALDVLIVGRGGGSMEDLWAFNQEPIANAVYACKVPVISAVGHQTDTTICDFVADRRAATPSQAAEFAVPDAKELLARITQKRKMIASDMHNIIAQKKQWLDSLNRSPYIRDPRTPLHQRMQYADDLQNRLLASAKHILPLKQTRHSQQNTDLAKMGSVLIDSRQVKLANLQVKLGLLNPKNILSRGYSIVQTSDKKIISKVAQAKNKQSLSVTVADGIFEVEVKSS